MYTYDCIIFCAILLIECNKILLPTSVDLHLRTLRADTFHKMYYFFFRNRIPHDSYCTERTFIYTYYTLTRCDKFICSYSEDNKKIVNEKYTSASINPMDQFGVQELNSLIVKCFISLPRYV